MSVIITHRYVAFPLIKDLRLINFHYMTWWASQSTVYMIGWNDDDDDDDGAFSVSYRYVYI